METREQVIESEVDGDQTVCVLMRLQERHGLTQLRVGRHVAMIAAVQHGVGGFAGTPDLVQVHRHAFACFRRDYVVGVTFIGALTFGIGRGGLNTDRRRGADVEIEHRDRSVRASSRGTHHAKWRERSGHGDGEYRCAHTAVDVLHRFLPSGARAYRDSFGSRASTRGSRTAKANKSWAASTSLMGIIKV